jgi:hypothetical protein
LTGGRVDRRTPCSRGSCADAGKHLEEGLDVVTDFRPSKASSNVQGFSVGVREQSVVVLDQDRLPVREGEGVRAIGVGEVGADSETVVVRQELSNILFSAASRSRYRRWMEEIVLQMPTPPLQRREVGIAALGEVSKVGATTAQVLVVTIT